MLFDYVYDDIRLAKLFIRKWHEWGDKHRDKHRDVARNERLAVLTLAAAVHEFLGIAEGVKDRSSVQNTVESYFAAFKISCIAGSSNS